MSSVRSSLSCLLMVVALVAAAQSTEWEQTKFPGANHVNFIQIIDEQLLVGSVQGLFLSPDKGDSWVNLTEKHDIRCVEALLKLGENYFIVAATQGVFYSNNLESWWPLGTGLPTYVRQLEFFEDKYYAATSDAVYALKVNSDKWEPDGLDIDIIHNRFIFDVRAFDGTLYASGCERLYRKSTDGKWEVIDTSYQYCGGEMLALDQSLLLNTTGDGIQRFSRAEGVKEEVIIVDSRDSLSFSVADLFLHGDQLVVLSNESIYYPHLNSREKVCDDVLTAGAAGLGNFFVGTDGLGVWRKAAPQLQPDPGEVLRRSDLPDTEIGLAVFPNPAPDRFSVQYLLPENEPATFSIFDLQGRLLLQKSVSAGAADEYVLGRPGLYLAVLSSGRRSVTQKIVIY